MYFKPERCFFVYSRTAIDRTRMARLSCLVFESLRNSSNISRKIFRDIFLFYNEIACYVYSLESPCRGDSNKYSQHTIFVYKNKKKKISIKYLHLLSDLAPWIILSGSNPQWLELPISQTNFQGPKHVLTTEIRMYIIEQRIPQRPC